jgi:hypothetical protein
MADKLPNPFVRFARPLTHAHRTRCSENRVRVLVNDSELDPVGFFRIKFDSAVWSKLDDNSFDSSALREKVFFVSHGPSWPLQLPTSNDCKSVIETD